MLLSVFTRHSPDCRYSKHRACRRCNCPKWVGGQINGYYFRQSAKTRQWAEAETVRLKLEDALAKGLPPFWAAVAGTEPSVRETEPSLPVPAVPPEAPPTPWHEIGPKPRPGVTVAQAVEAYLADAVTRIRLRVDRYMGEDRKAHLLSVFGNGSDVGAITAAVHEKATFSLAFPGGTIKDVSLGEHASCYKGAVTLPGRKHPVRHLLAVSQELIRMTAPGERSCFATGAGRHGPLW